MHDFTRIWTGLGGKIVRLTRVRGQFTDDNWPLENSGHQGGTSEHSLSSTAGEHAAAGRGHARVPLPHNGEGPPVNLVGDVLSGTGILGPGRGGLAVVAARGWGKLLGLCPSDLGLAERLAAAEDGAGTARRGRRRRWGRAPKRREGRARRGLAVVVVIAIVVVVVVIVRVVAATVTAESEVSVAVVVIAVVVAVADVVMMVLLGKKVAHFFVGVVVVGQVLVGLGLLGLVAQGGAPVGLLLVVEPGEGVVDEVVVGALPLDVHGGILLCCFCCRRFVGVGSQVVPDLGECGGGESLGEHDGSTVPEETNKDAAASLVGVLDPEERGRRLRWGEAR